jgi:hypothetical protein
MENEILWKYRELRNEWLKITPDIVRRLDKFVLNEVFIGNICTGMTISSTLLFCRHGDHMGFDRILGHYYKYTDPDDLYDEPIHSLNGKMIYMDFPDIKRGDINASVSYPHVVFRHTNGSVIKRELIAPIEELKKDENVNYCNKLYQYYTQSKYNRYMSFRDTTPFMERIQGIKMKQCKLKIKHPVAEVL